MSKKQKQEWIRGKYYSNVAKAMIAKGRVDVNALKQINKSLDLVPSSEAFELRAQIEDNLLQFPEAIEDSLETLRRGAKNKVKTMKQLAKVEYCAGEPVRALLYYHRAGQLRTHDPEILSGIFASEAAIENMTKIEHHLAAAEAHTMEDFESDTKPKVSADPNYSPCEEETSEVNGMSPRKSRGNWALSLAPDELRINYQFAKKILEVERERERKLRQARNGPTNEEQKKLSQYIQNMASDLSRKLDTLAITYFKLG
ncbi:hypothetical protein Ciccas_008087 [Cichlidogyrus casuarinus]|uniref:Uncharacterized protein n=1 Tax=Cichlidogyrus casuarinus TaxID=1844966 RepID=A0ABD2Q132_9PLAT